MNKKSDKKELLHVVAYDFGKIIKYSVYIFLMSFVLMFLSAMLLKYVHPLMNAMIVIGMPYGIFVTLVKKNADVINFKDGEIILKDRKIALDSMESCHLFDALRLYFALRITLKTGQHYIYYLPIDVKEDISVYINQLDLPTSKRLVDFIAKYYALLYVLPFLILLGLAYYLGTQVLYF